MHLLHADPSDAVVFGDGLNDLTMFRKPFFAIAMGNARPVLKERADYVTQDNDKAESSMPAGNLAGCRKNSSAGVCVPFVRQAAELR